METFSKIRKIIESDLVGDLADIAAVLGQKLGGTGEAQHTDKFTGGVVGDSSGRNATQA